jgi:hypothetical protein
MSASAQVSAVSGAVSAPAGALKTPWGEPDLQGIWTEEFDTSLQRPAKYADQQFFAEEQRAELDKERTEVLNRRAVGTPNDAYNFAAFLTTKRTGARTSKIVDPLNGRIPPLPLEAHSEDGLRRSEISPCSAAGDRDMQEPVAGLCGRQVRSDALAPTLRSKIDVHHHFFQPSFLQARRAALARQNRPTAFGPGDNWSVGKAIETMDRNGIGTAVLSIPTPGRGSEMLKSQCVSAGLQRVRGRDDA